jgi:hypothetical protein
MGLRILRDHPQRFFPQGHPDHLTNGKIQILESIIWDRNFKRDLSFKGLEIDRMVSSPVNDLENLSFENVSF